MLLFLKLFLSYAKEEKYYLSIGHYKDYYYIIIYQTVPLFAKDVKYYFSVAHYKIYFHIIISQTLLFIYQRGKVFLFNMSL